MLDIVRYCLDLIGDEQELGELDSFPPTIIVAWAVERDISLLFTVVVLDFIDIQTPDIRWNLKK